MVGDRVREAVKRILPFRLTEAQKRVLREIADDMQSRHPMHRLVQGDVGSGKTMVALLAMVIAVENGYQAAFMAPTEILAEQHFLTFRRLLARCPYEVELVTAGALGSRARGRPRRSAWPRGPSRSPWARTRSSRRRSASTASASRSSTSSTASACCSATTSRARAAAPTCWS